MLLANNICHFKKLYDNPNNIKYDIFCSAFFKMNKHYKDFNIYMDGLRRITKKIKELNINYKLRIFIDKNIYDDKQIMDIFNENKDFVQLVIFTCANYMKDNYHFDVFGSLVRYFPLFDFENNDSNNVIIVDMDLQDSDMITLENFIKFNKPIMCKLPPASTLLKGESSIYIISNLVYFNNIKYDKNILIDYIKNAHNIKDTGNYKKRFTPFGYGVDEIFLNKYLFKQIKYFYCNTIYTPNLFIFYNKKFIMQNKNSYSRFKYILGKYFKAKYDLKYMIQFFDDNFYNITKKTDINNYISRRFYKIINQLYPLKKYIFPKKITELIVNHLNNIIYAQLNIKIDNTGNEMKINKIDIMDIVKKPIYID
jgi:hypothetical protein